MTCGEKINNENNDFSNSKSSRRVLFRTGSMMNNLMKCDNIDAPKESPPNFFKKDVTESLFSFLRYELTMDYQLEHDEERYSAKREKVYSFMKIPMEIERFMLYGFMQCIDSFLFICAFLPIRVAAAMWTLMTKPFRKCFGLKSRGKLTPAEICDILRAIILIFCSMVICLIDPNVLYHLIKSQSTIKLYLFYNMLEVGDRLFSSIGQDAIDALFWTATEPKQRKREHLGIIAHLFFAMVYVILHSILVLLQATTLNVAINSSNKVLLTIMMSNNFVELKGSVFKKFDKNNLFQLSCSDVRERFHLCFLLFIVVMQTMKEYSWKTEHFWLLLPDCVVVLVVEFFVDWLKHAFITKFNDLSLDIYRDYTTSLAYDLAQTRQNHAFTDCCDLVARRMGFIPLPLGVVLIRILIATTTIDNWSNVFVCSLIYFIIVQWKILASILVMGRACDLITQHKHDKALLMSPINIKLLANKDLVKVTAKEVASSPLHVSLQKDNILNITGSENLIDEQLMPNDLGSAAIFANSTVDLRNAKLNEEVLKADSEGIEVEANEGEIITRSFPNITADFEEDVGNGLKRAESEPALNTCNNEDDEKETHKNEIKIQNKNST
ncbi:protein TAPT1 homolog [Coccinella septempunctata]|uniref:protein TAPT1 homolog n=1 Tax=Coccinella septempunctata TaxID=41139 RepID=UPI001D0919BA|nr:protein TAPT1 homolog [Coccinella septempunctata]